MHRLSRHLEELEAHYEVIVVGSGYGVDAHVFRRTRPSGHPDTPRTSIPVQSGLGPRRPPRGARISGAGRVLGQRV
jgi:hypothetical protein